MLAVVALALGGALLSTSVLAAEVGSATAGQAFAATHCARCHATGPAGDSPLAVAPPFRTLRGRFVFEWLERALAEGIGVGHRDAQFMPETVLSKPVIDDLIAYLRTLPAPSGQPDERRFPEEFR
jgi:mono/diheme cytochrome c family protein